MSYDDPNEWDEEPHYKGHYDHDLLKGSGKAIHKHIQHERAESVKAHHKKFAGKALDKAGKQLSIGKTKKMLKVKNIKRGEPL